jgi:hypothetical protein
MKELIAQKVVIEFDGNVFSNGVIFYKINEDGVIGKFKSVSVKNADFSKPALNGILAQFIAYAKEMEGIQ